MIEERYYDKTFTPSLEREILEIQHELSLIEVRVKLQQAQEQIRIVPAEEVSKPSIVRRWIEVLFCFLLGGAGLLGVCGFLFLVWEGAVGLWRLAGL